MSEKIVISILNKNEYLKKPIEIGLDNEWVKKSRYFDQRVKAQGVYILHFSNPPQVIYIGKTRGPTMNFTIRLYRHATKTASNSSRVYRTLKKVERETGGPILVSLVTTEQIRSFFEGKPLGDDAMVDICEQVLIHLLKPELQQ